jgi:hypothetical protein
MKKMGFNWIPFSDLLQMSTQKTMFIKKHFDCQALIYQAEEIIFPNPQNVLMRRHIHFTSLALVTKQDIHLGG